MFDILTGMWNTVRRSIGRALNMTAAEQAREAAVEALAITHGLDVAGAEAAIAAAGGDFLLELDSKTAEFLIAAIEIRLGKTLPTPADLGRVSIATLGILLEVLAPLLSAPS
jgi:hypothetical protein